FGMDQFRTGLKRRSGIEQRSDQGRVPEQEKFTIGMTRKRKLRAGDDHGRTVISPHRIKRNTDPICHWTNRAVTTAPKPKFASGLDLLSCEFSTQSDSCKPLW